MWVTDRKSIAIHYLSGWFLIDVFSIAPSLFDIIPILNAYNAAARAADGEDAGKGTSGLKALKIVRVLRFVKLVRLARGSLVEVAGWPAG